MTIDEKDVLSAVQPLLYLDGEWVESEHREAFSVEDPATERELARVQDASAADGLRALEAADAAAGRWSRTSSRERADLLSRAYDLVIRHRGELALVMSLEMGKPLSEADAEVGYGAEFLRWFAEEAVRISGRYGQNPEGTGVSIVSHRAVGPSLLITPWNFPLAMATRKIAPALAAGCTVVIKPSELTPLTTLRFVQLLEEAGLPRGVVNVITTIRSPEVIAPLMADPRLRKLSFTGSTAVGRTLLAQASARVLRTSMELGGNAPFIVFADADLDAAAEGAMKAKFRNMGQACTAANRFLVEASVVDEFAARVARQAADLRIGRGTDPSVTMGPLIDARAVARVGGLVADAEERGARMLLGGTAHRGPGHFFPPTVLVDVDPSSRLFTEEIFGPVLGIATFEGEEEALRLANRTEYGLASYVYTKDLDRMHRLIPSIDAGMTGFNTGLISNASAPFGGVKQSGLGREGGAEGIHEYLAVNYSLLGITR